MTIPTPVSQWDIHVSAWIIQDGNYDNFRQGQIATFALEFWNTVHRSDTCSKMVQPVGNARYRIQGEVLYTAPGVWVVDYGIRSYCEDVRPKGVETGTFVTGEIGLGIDYYAYMEFLYKRPAIPALMYTWRIDRISQLSAPFVPATTPWGAPALERDMSRASYTDIERTQAWEDDRGHAEYVLRCTLLDSEPTAPHRYPLRS